MANDTLSCIEAILAEAQALTPAKKEELLVLLARLRREMEALDASHAGTAQAIAEQAHALAEQAIDPRRDVESFGLGLTRLSKSVEGFEESHPRLVQVTNTICTALSNMGI